VSIIRWDLEAQVVATVARSIPAGIPEELAVEEQAEQERSEAHWQQCVDEAIARCEAERERRGVRYWLRASAW